MTEDAERRRGDAAQGLANAVYQTLRTDVLRGRYRPHQRLVELELAEKLSASRTPIREALQRLVIDGLVVRTRQGWTVREFTLEEIGDIYGSRAALESYAVRRVAMQNRELNFDAVRALLAEQKALGRDPVRLREQSVDLNDQFHTTLAGLCGNRNLLSLLERARSYYFNYHLATLYTTDELSHSLAEHEAIFQAVMQGEADYAASLMRMHVETAFDLIADKIPAR